MLNLDSKCAQYWQKASIHELYIYAVPYVLRHSWRPGRAGSGPPLTGSRSYPAGGAGPGRDSNSSASGRRGGQPQAASAATLPWTDRGHHDARSPPAGPG